MTAGDVMQGHRIFGVDQEHDGRLWFRAEPGGYWRGGDGDWCGCTPNGLIASLVDHNVVEHEDGTITVTPSILVEGASRLTRGQVRSWHGHLQRGVWREV